jgi:pyruvate formate-lyase/glycerol dehydratase family glycyl radical enzyme
MITLFARAAWRRYAQARGLIMWRNILTGAEVYQAMRQDAAGRDFNRAALARAASYQATCAQPMTIRRAQALNDVLRQVELIHFPGELLVGSSIGRLVAGTDELRRQLETARPILEATAGRDFLSHNDHHAPDYPTLLHLGIGGLARRAMQSQSRQTEPQGRVFLESVRIALNGVREHLRRWADHLRRMAADHVDHALLLGQQASMMHRLAEEPPVTFWEAVQLVWIVHTVLQCDERWAMALGRLDRYLLPFYRADIDVGGIPPERAQAVLDHLFGKLTGLGGDIQNIAIGGVTPDGSDATNDLSYMILESCKHVGKPGGNVTARIHADTPAAFLRKCSEVIRTGIGYPAVVNDEVLVPALIEQGIPPQDARDYCFVGCIETFIPGKMAPWADSRFNLLYCANLVVFRGVDSLTGNLAGIDTGEPATWGEFRQAYLVQMRDQLRRHIERLDARKQPFQDRAAEFTSPLLSALTADCIDRGLDLNDGGARYPANHGVAAMGIGVTADALAAVKRFVYDRQVFTMDQIRTMLRANFDGYEAERQQLLHGAPKYGNNDDEADAIAVEVTRAVGEECLKYRNPQGGRYWALMAANVQNVSAGREVGASPDGRLRGQPLSDAASPTFGRDVRGPTALVHSISKLPYACCPGGNVINVKMHPSALREEAGLSALASLIRTCFDLGGVQLQFNTVDREVLQKAMAEPEHYRDLVVRVSGFSAHFVTLDRAVQEDILRRTQHVLA